MLYAILTCPLRHGLRLEKLYSSVELTPAPVRIPTQRPLFRSFASIVG